MASTQDLGKVRLVAKGAYNAATNYEADDWVTYEGSSYYCKQDSTGHAPTDTTYWGLLASKGDAGASPDITMSATSDGTSSDSPTVTVTKGGTTSNPTYALAFSGLKGEKGDTGDTGDSLTASSVHADDKTTVTIKNARTEETVNTFDVPDGEDGKGINNITKTGTSGLVDTYTITYTDGTTSTFTVTNGQDGQGSGDMTKAVYDSAEAVANAGGITAYLAAQLANYYTKSQAYSKSEVDSLISAITTMNIEVVASLPTQDISTTTIYLVPSADPQTQNVKDEYINTDGTSAGWELIGSTAIDLSGYVQKSQTAGLLKNDGTVNTTIEGAVTANTNAISAIKDGQSIDSFGDVESALDDKVDWESNTLTGVHNLFDYKNTPIDDYQTTHSFITNGVNVVSWQSGNWSNSFYIFPNKYKNTDVKFSCDVDYVSGNFRLDIKGNNSTTPSGTELAYDSTTVDKHMELSFNTGDTTYIIIQFMVTNGTGGTGEANITNMMFRLATDTDPTFAPYAKTNRELTEDVANIPTVSVTHTGTASSTGVRKQQITVNNVSYDVDGSAYMEQTVTLSTSQATDVVFINAIIADGTELTFSSSIWDLVPDDMVTTVGVCTVTLPKWTSAVTIGCRLRVR